MVTCGERELREDADPSCALCATLCTGTTVQCAECRESFLLCLDCFRRGQEGRGHLSSHAYSIVRRDICLLEEGWTAGRTKIKCSVAEPLLFWAAPEVQGPGADSVSRLNN